ncbi:hypothetical protein [Candidatus Avelusimicrobium luingense]|uniref:hypothetical protein n=1 Tax=Candidatus Avelusimicrobium luingense TaxID=3416211 RepID=UPI003D0A8C66
MNNKMLLMLLAVGLFVPAFAADEVAVPAKSGGYPMMAQQKKGEFMKAQQEQRAKMKATEEKMEKLVKEYKKLKGKKQDAKKAEIVAEVEKIHVEQLKFKQNQLDQFAQRLEEMKKHVAEEQSADAQKKWVDEKTAALIEKDGDLKVLFDRIDQGPQKGHMKGFKNGKGHKFGPKDGKGPRMGEGDPRRVGLNPPPPPPLEEK